MVLLALYEEEGQRSTLSAAARLSGMTGMTKRHVKIGSINP
jgi:hypothetical protein